MAITDLTNTTWYVPSGWASGTVNGAFSIKGKIKVPDNLGDMFFDITSFEIESDVVTVNIINSPFYEGFNYVFPEYSFELVINGGNDVTNPELIAWLSKYGELQGGEEEQPTTPTKKFTRLYLGAIAHTSNGKRFRKLQYTEYVEPSEPEQPEEPVALDGLFDANGVQIVSWDTLVNDYGLDVETDYSSSSDDANYYQTPASSPYNVFQNSAFSSAEEMVIGDSVEKIGYYAFFSSDINLIKSLTIGNNVTHISGYAFSTFKMLESITLGNAVKNIDAGAFQSTTLSLTSITIPENVESIARTAFGTTALSTAYINSNKLVNICQFNPAGTLSIYFNAYSEDTEVLFDTTTSLTTAFLTQGSSKVTRNYNIYTDNTVLKNASLAFVDSYTIVNVYHLDGSEWEA